MTTFAKYLSGETQIKFPEGLILGWLVEDRVSNLEYRYALDKGGQAYRSQAKLGSDDFDTIRRNWYPVTTIPNSAEFIGYYKAPKRIVRV
jgi:hypothetical protein